jgi:dihydrofolate reductase
MIKIIVATNKRGVIGAKGVLPWHSKVDLNLFRKLTFDDIVIMGKETWISLPPKARPLIGRINVILTNKEYDYYKGKFEKLSASGDTDVWVHKSLEEAINFSIALYPRKNICVIGGESVYNAAMKYADRIHHTIIDKEVADGDRFFWPNTTNTEWNMSALEDYVENIDDQQVSIRHMTYDRIVKHDQKKTVLAPPATPERQTMFTGKHEQIATMLGRMVDEKNRQYGGSYQETETVLKLLWPDGIPTTSYPDFLCIMRIWDKMKRIGASKGQDDLGGEDARKDLLGIAIRMLEASK